jgi:cytoskeletal protein CcmA (bactofilin family)
MADNHDGTIIAADTIIKGDMAVESRARILGRFEGTIRSKGQLEVADKGTCQAAVEANTVQIDGTVEGNVTATDKVQLSASGRMTGDLVAAKLIVTEGAAFTGHVTVGPNAVKARTAESAGRPAQASAGSASGSNEPAGRTGPGLPGGARDTAVPPKKQ